MNTYEYINDFYSGIDDEDLFEYKDDFTDVYRKEDNDAEFESTSLIKVTYEGNDYYFTSNFIKVKYSIEKNLYYAIKTDLPYDVEFKFPKNHKFQLKLLPKLNLEYDEIHDLIIDKALNIAIKYIQSNYINFCYDEIDSLKKRNKDINRLVDNTQLLLMKMQQENELLKKRLDKLERMNSPNKVDSFLDKKQVVI